MQTRRSKRIAKATESFASALNSVRSTLSPPQKSRGKKKAPHRTRRQKQADRQAEMERAGPPSPVASPETAGSSPPSFKLANLQANALGSPYPAAADGSPVDPESPVLLLSDDENSPRAIAFPRRVVDELASVTARLQLTESVAVDALAVDPLAVDPLAIEAAPVSPDGQWIALPPSDEAIEKFDGFQAPQPPNGTPPMDDDSQRVVRYSNDGFFWREVSNHTIGDPIHRGRKVYGLVQLWTDIRPGSRHMHYVVFKSLEEETRDIIMLAYRYLPFEDIHRSYCGTAGEHWKVKMDVYCESGYAEPGTYLAPGKAKPKRAFFEFPTEEQYICFIAGHYPSDGSKFFKEWYDKNGRFYQPPHANPFQINNPHGMEVDQLNGQPILDHERPLDSDQEDEFFPGGIQEQSQQPWTSLI